MSPRGGPGEQRSWTAPFTFRPHGAGFRLDGGGPDIWHGTAAGFHTLEEEIATTDEGKTIISGGCHCGNVTFRLAASRPPEDLSVRACGCRFCRQHAALSTSDPDGHVSFAVSEPGRLARYRFGLKTADFLVCQNCGVYVGALMPDGDRAYAILNVNACGEPQRFLQKSAAMDYGAEDEAGRQARRRAKWTPADLQIEVNS